MAIPDFQTLMLPILRRFADCPGQTADMVDAVATEFALTDAERQELLPSGRVRTIANRTHWAIAYLHRAGLLARLARGRYDITPRGRAILMSPPDRITISFLHQFPEFATLRADGRREAARLDATPEANTAETVAVAVGTPEERLEAADRELRDELVVALLNRVRALSPEAFEQLIIDLLVRMGYGGSRRDAAERLGRSGDGGVDGVIREDALGLEAIYVQAKRYGADNPIGAPAIQGFAGALLGKGATKGVFVTTSRFTGQAREVGNAYRSHRIIMLDGEELAELMIEHEIGVRTVQTIKVQRVDLEAYEGEAGA